ncbi:TPA: MucBP domain-containing protein, partial [Streptococcus suis]|nr:MucBP domain-containing protein [Streptococcus suis]
TVASGLTYDATTQKPTSITSNGKVYELVQVKDGDVEQGLVSEGTTTVTYIYRHVPQVTTDVKTSTTTGSVNVKYVDTEGNEIQGAVNLVTDGVVSTTTTTTTTTDGVASVTEDTVASGLTYDATTQKPASITYNGKVYELVQVKDGDVEQGLVSEGTTTVTYIYQVVPNKTETTSEAVTGTVITRYVDIDTGEEIVSGSTIVDNGIVANTVITTERNAAGEIVYQTVETIPTGLTYDTTSDKTVKNAEIALIQIPVTDIAVADVPAVGTSKVNNGDGTVTISYTMNSNIMVLDSNFRTLGEAEVLNRIEKELTSQATPMFPEATWSFDPFVTYLETPIPAGDGVSNYVATKSYTAHATFDISGRTTSYTFVSVDASEVGAVEEGTTIITYYYRKVPLTIETVAFPLGLESLTVATLPRDF